MNTNPIVRNRPFKISLWFQVFYYWQTNASDTIIRVSFKKWFFIHISSKITFIYINIWLVCLGVCLFVCIQKKSKRRNQSGPNFVWDFAWPQERFMDDQIFKNLSPLKFDFWKFWKSTKFFWKIREIFCFCYLFTRRSPVYFIFTNEIKDGREAP